MQIGKKSHQSAMSNNHRDTDCKKILLSKHWKPTQIYESKINKLLPLKYHITYRPWITGNERRKHM